MTHLKYFFFLSLFFLGNRSFSQDTLPRITVKNISNKVIVSWTNTYGANISTINIQRSSDSIKNFITIGSVLEPMNRENGFVDSKSPNPKMFYRVFVAFEGGRYFFTASYHPVKDSSVAISDKIEDMIPGYKNSPANTSKTPGLTPIPSPLSPPPPPKYVFVPSKFIYIGKDNNVIIELSEATGSRFSVKFYDEKDNPIFEIKKISEPFLIIEKVNFKHAGWFYFKLFDNGILKERNQFYIPKEGKTGIPPGEMNRQLK